MGGPDQWEEGTRVWWCGDTFTDGRRAPFRVKLRSEHSDLLMSAQFGVAKLSDVILTETTIIFIIIVVFVVINWVKALWLGWGTQTFWCLVSGKYQTLSYTRPHCHINITQGWAGMTFGLLERERELLNPFPNFGNGNGNEQAHKAR